MGERFVEEGPLEFEERLEVYLFENGPFAFGSFFILLAPIATDGFFDFRGNHIEVVIRVGPIALVSLRRSRY